ncbi:hypothetical protein [Devosia geojensis]|uniref:hypothetical protein n=1 Tax=Devosia geojensis TaxID=443610 RepID=UPI000A7138AC|nr:hypothetical protein [Devosia geojensis]
MPATDVTLSSAVHDPRGRLVPAIERLAPALKATFSHVALNISDATAPDVVTAARSLLDAEIIFHPAGEAMIGCRRRDAVRLGLRSDAVLYSDPDHLLRWIEFGPDNLRGILTGHAAIDFLVIGRSAQALSAEPRRLRETERLVNHIHTLITGERWDLMFAVRRMSKNAAALIVEHGKVDTLANDVEWPLLAREAGLNVGYAESDALFYRTIEEFGAPADTGDEEPLQWIRRMEFAAQHASAMRRFLK